MKRQHLIKIVIIFAVLLWSLWSLYPTIKMQTLTDDAANKLKLEGKYDNLQNKAIKRGLDLQGGIYLVLEVDLAQLAVDLAENKDDAFYQTIDECKKTLKSDPEADFFSVLSNLFSSKNMALNRYFGTRLDSDSDILDNMRKQAEDAIDRSREILWNRVDQFGVSEPNIQKRGNRRILVELPGIQEIQRAKELVNQTALLEFKMVVDPDITTDLLRKIDDKMKEKRGILPKTEALDSTKTADTAQTGKDTTQSEVVRAEDLFGTTEPKPGSDTTSTDTSALEVDKTLFNESPFLALLRRLTEYGGTMGVPQKNRFAVEKILADPDIQALIPPDAQFLWSSAATPVRDDFYYELYLVKKEPELTGKYLTDAQVKIGSGGSGFGASGKPEVHFQLNSEGSRLFARTTGANVGKDMAIILDGKVFTSPKINTKITRGNPYIEGIPDMKEAQEIAIVLRAGALPAPIEIIEERTVGPSLGADSIRKGTQSALLGLLVVVIFMIFYYRMSGAIADVALLMNLIVVLAILAGFQFVLTLPGVAGIILTIGMAVDANVLIFERIREEIRAGKTVRAAIDTGYARALSAIIDANITTLFTAVVLYQFGTGPIRGFALTLFIGILTSLFTALVVTRAIFDFLTARFAFKKLSI